MSFQPEWNEVRPGDKWSILTKQKRFALWAIYISLGCMMVGFDFGIAGTVTAYPAFQKQFGIPYPSQPSGYLVPARYQSGWSGASSAGNFVGVIFAGQLLEIMGRKHVVAIGSIITAVGVAMQVASSEWKLFLAGRLINAIGFGVVFMECPVWIGENVRPELRGFFLCVTNGSIVFGQFVLSCVARGASEIDGHWSYQTLIVLQFLPVVLLIIGYPFFPESPYWLIRKGRHEDARKALNRIHGSDDQNLIEAELVRMEQMVTSSNDIANMAAKNGSLFVQCLQGRNLKRTIIAMLPVVAQQFIGAAFVLGYITYFLSLLKISNFFTVNLILYIVMMISNISAFMFIETAGRRPLIVYGMVLLTLIELLMGIMGCLTANGAIWVILVCIFLWAIVYQLSLGAVGYAVGAEVSSLPLRPTVQSYVMMAGAVFGWAIGFASPYMINPDAGNLGAKVGFVFAGCGVPLCVALFFLIPETRGLSFEELDYLFDNNVSCRQFTKAIEEYRITSNTPDEKGEDKYEIENVVAKTV